MSSLRTVFVLLWSFVFHVQHAVSGPVEVSGRYQRGSTAEQNEWRLVLSSIESRLKSLDFLYTSQLTPTLEKRLEHFQNRISGMEVKLLRVEALLTSKLDRMSDNISSKHFRDDMVQTDIFRKIETAYDGITHRLAYMDRKSENSFTKLQDTYVDFSKKLDAMNNALTDKYDSIESQLSDVVDGMEDINTSFHKNVKKTENRPVSHNNKTQTKQYEMQDTSRSYPEQEILNEVQTICENSCEETNKIEEESHNFTDENLIANHFNNFSNYLGNIINEYASKVSDLGAQVTKSDFKIATHLSTIEAVVNSTKAEMQNALRALTLQVGKLSPKDKTHYEIVDQNVLSDVAQKIDTNFEKVIATQNTFLESCHRLQMDESQMEDQISDILNKLIDNFEGTTRDQHHVMKKIETLLVKHDLHTRKELHQANANIMTVYEQNKKDLKDTIEQHKKTADSLQDLLGILNNNSNSVVKRGISKEKELVEYIESLENTLNITKMEQMEMLRSHKSSVEMLLKLMQTKQQEENSTLIILRNLTQNMSSLKRHFRDVSKKLNTNITTDILKYIEKTYELTMENSEYLKNISEYNYIKSNKTKDKTITMGKDDYLSINNMTKSDNFSDIDALIKEIFFANATSSTSSTTEVPCLDIDVRFDSEENGNNTKPAKCQNSSESDDQIIFSPEQETMEEKDGLVFDLDTRFGQAGKINSSEKPNSNKDHKMNREDFVDQYTENSTEENNIKLIHQIIPFLKTTNNTNTVDIHIK